ncbi:hypothetical protein LOTGIDRAFT_231890 [Lottia gigantea]|uniref:Profilin n=1 Tax=Lottia gigantea TaxID=225164 RepID=V4ALL6_LOTGI|nr:hypothetical protein LOTGIDRAFT_231890 [Lottia gigantea]ESO95655.1 hypothetical protein LOTGIDRAFT_231890 [Lottia gigantea]
MCGFRVANLFIKSISQEWSFEDFYCRRLKRQKKMSAGMCFDARAMPQKEKCFKPKWRKWIDLIIRTGSKFGLKQACLIKNSGVVVASVVGLDIGKEEFQTITNAFNQSEVEVLRLAGTTYCIKSQNAKQMVAFNGGKYLIITRSKTMIIVCICVDKNKLDMAGTWLQKVGDCIDS